MIKYFIPFLALILSNCDGSQKKEFTYFGGKIINPKGDFVILYDHNEKVIDSIQLQKNNTFLGKLDNIEAGLYCFKHGSEFQHVYLEPKDSLLLRLNTWDFDESLVFSGTNAEKNNVLMEVFLTNEQQDKDFYNYFSLPAATFKNKVDSLTGLKNEFITDFVSSNNETSEKFIDILNTALHYPLYTKLENYIIKNSRKEKAEILDDSFTLHRETTSINDTTLMFFKPYRKYVYANLYGHVYQKNIKDDSNEFTIEVLDIINEKITSQNFKNNLLRQTTIQHFYSKSSCSIDKKAYNTFLSYSTNEKDKEKITKLLKDVKHIKKNKSIPNFKVTTPFGSKEYVSELIKNKSSVIYFRNKAYASDNWVSSRMNYLIAKNPEINFLVVDISPAKEYIKGLDIKHQYYLDENSKAHQFLTSKFPRMVLVNNNGTVVNAFCAISSKKIERQITEL